MLRKDDEEPLSLKMEVPNDNHTGGESSNDADQCTSGQKTDRNNRDNIETVHQSVTNTRKPRKRKKCHSEAMGQLAREFNEKEFRERNEVDDLTQEVRCGTNVKKMKSAADWSYSNRFNKLHMRNLPLTMDKVAYKQVPNEEDNQHFPFFNTSPYLKGFKASKVAATTRSIVFSDYEQKGSSSEDEIEDNDLSGDARCNGKQVANNKIASSPERDIDRIKDAKEEHSEYLSDAEEVAHVSDKAPRAKKGAVDILRKEYNIPKFKTKHPLFGHKLHYKQNRPSEDNKRRSAFWNIPSTIKDTFERFSPHAVYENDSDVLTKESQIASDSSLDENEENECMSDGINSTQGKSYIPQKRTKFPMCKSRQSQKQSSSKQEQPSTCLNVSQSIIDTSSNADSSLTFNEAQGSANSQEDENCEYERMEGFSRISRSINNRSPSDVRYQSSGSRTSPQSITSTRSVHVRTKYTTEDVRVLQRAFDENPYPEMNVIDNLSQELNVPKDRIKVWFQNKRHRSRRNESMTSHIGPSPFMPFMHPFMPFNLGAMTAGLYSNMPGHYFSYPRMSPPTNFSQFPSFHRVRSLGNSISATRGTDDDE